jgi:hypothetical protein
MRGLVVALSAMAASAACGGGEIGASPGDAGHAGGVADAAPDGSIGRGGDGGDDAGMAAGETGATEADASPPCGPATAVTLPAGYLMLDATFHVDSAGMVLGLRNDPDAPAPARGSLLGTATSGGQFMTLFAFDLSDSLYSVAADASTVYFTGVRVQDGLTLGIYALPRAGGGVPQRIVSFGPGQYVALVTGGSSIYLAVLDETTLPGVESIHALPSPGAPLGAPMYTVPAGVSLGPATVDGTTIYWAETSAAAMAIQAAPLASALLPVTMAQSALPPQFSRLSLVHTGMSTLLSVFPGPAPPRKHDPLAADASAPLAYGIYAVAAASTLELVDPAGSGPIVLGAGAATYADQAGDALRTLPLGSLTPAVAFAAPSFIESFGVGPSNALYYVLRAAPRCIERAP